MAAEIVRRNGERVAPALDAVAQGTVYILERLRGRGAGLTVTVENAARRYFLVGFVTEEGVFEGYLLVAGIEAHGGSELVARGGGLSYFQQCVGQVFAHGGAVRREGDGAL